MDGKKRENRKYVLNLKRGNKTKLFAACIGRNDDDDDEMAGLLLWR